MEALAALDFFQLHVPIGLWIFGAMTLLWVVSLSLKNSSIVDIFWGMGFVVSVWLLFILTSQSPGPRDWLIAILVTIWGCRLSIYVLWRNAGKGEDFRYAKWRREAGDSWWWRSYFKVFMLQGLIMWVVASPLTAIQLPGNVNTLGALDIIGTGLWAMGFFFEAVGDYQLSRFKAHRENKGKLLQSGLWRLTRHPNYFGDALQWWGFYLIAVSAGAWWTIFSPMLMTYLLLNVSGVAMLERTLKLDKPGYQSYVERTSAFVPWFPKDENNQKEEK